MGEQQEAMKKYFTLLLCSLCALAAFTACADSTAGLKDVKVVMSTTKGDIELALYPSKEAAAQAVELVPLSELLPKDWKGAEER